MAGVEMFPRGFGNVAFVLVAYCFLNFWMGFQVGSARKKYKVPYPTLYAIESENKDAKLFNCVQVLFPLPPCLFFSCFCLVWFGFLKGGF
jgi:glutathione S-transferase